MKLVWSDRSIADLTEIRDYIARDSESSAKKCIAGLLDAAERLLAFPDLGRRIPSAPDLPTLRESVIGNYRVIYRRHFERVEIVRVVQIRRQLYSVES